MILERKPEAEQYLRTHGYTTVKTNAETRVAYKHGTGDKTWEGKGLDHPSVASQNGWFLREARNETCCKPFEKKKPRADYCGKCGEPINGTVVYMRDEFDLSDILTEAEALQMF